MQSDNSNAISIMIMYFAIFIRYLYFRTSIFDVQFLSSTIIMMIIICINNFSEKLSKEILDIGKFLAHILFISVCFSVFCGFLSTIYAIIFYYGFVNTVIFINICFVSFISGITSIFGKQINHQLSKSVIGKTFLKSLNYYYNLFVISGKLYEKTVSFVSMIFKNYIWYFAKKIFFKLVNLNFFLGENNHSISVKNKVYGYFTDGKNYMFEQLLQRQFINSFNKSMLTDPFSEGINNISKKLHKANLPSDDIQMNFLKNTTIVDGEKLDDLDDDELTDSPTKVDENETQPEEKTSTNLTTDQKRIALRKKIREMRDARGGKTTTMSNKSKKTTKKDVTNLMNMPGIDQMMKTMFEGDNLEKIMRQIPKDKIRKKMPDINPDQMKKLLQSIKKN